MRIKFLGQAGFVFENEQQRILIDPYLSNYVVESGIGDPRFFKREFEPPVLPSELGKIDCIFITHDHADHCDPLTLKPILAINERCHVIGPKPVTEMIKNWGIESTRIITPSVDSQQRIGKIVYCAIPSAHYGLDQDPVTGCYPYFGYIITMGGLTIYHSGDTIFYNGMIERILEVNPKIIVACLPVNGRDAKREAMGIIGNLNAEEAFNLAAAIKASIVIPMHNDLFMINSQDPKVINHIYQEKYSGFELIWLSPGEILEQ